MGLFKKNLNEQTILVEGMKCVHCANKVVETLKKHKVKAEVNLENKNVNVKYDENHINLESIKILIEELGFKCL